MRHDAGRRGEVGVQYRWLRRSVHDPSHLGRMSGLLLIVRALEAFVRPPFGLSLVAVCRREAS